MQLLEQLIDGSSGIDRKPEYFFGDDLFSRLNGVWGFPLAI